VLALGVAALALAAPARAAALVAKVGRFRYGDDLVSIRLEVHADDMDDQGATIEPLVTATINGTVRRVQGRLERKSFGDSFRALRVQGPDNAWEDVNIWVPLRVPEP
jgi:hypothetical protein